MTEWAKYEFDFVTQRVLYSIVPDIYAWQVKTLKTVIAGILIFIGTPSLGFFQKSQPEAEQTIRTLLNDVETIRRNLHDENLRRIDEIQNTLEGLATTISDPNKGLAHVRNTNAYHQLVKLVRSSIPIFGFLVTQQSRNAILELVRTANKIGKETGEGEEPFKTLQPHFLALEGHLDELIRIPSLPDKLRRDLMDTLQQVHNAVAVTDLGDSPDLIIEAKASEIYFKILHGCPALTSPEILSQEPAGTLAQRVIDENEKIFGYLRTPILNQMKARMMENVWDLDGFGDEARNLK